MWVYRIYIVLYCMLRNQQKKNKPRKMESTVHQSEMSRCVHDEYECEVTDIICVICTSGRAKGERERERHESRSSSSSFVVRGVVNVGLRTHEPTIHPNHHDRSCRSVGHSLRGIHRPSTSKRGLRGYSSPESFLDPIGTVRTVMVREGD
jgi:hypothetical protein